MSSANTIWAVDELPTAVTPVTPAPVSPMSLLNVMTPAPSPAVAFTFNPPSALVSPIAPLKVTFPDPESIVRVLLPALSVSIAPPKETFPAPAVVVVIATLAERSTSEVLKAILSADVVKVAAPVMSIFPPPVAAV